MGRKKLPQREGGGRGSRLLRSSCDTTVRSAFGFCKINPCLMHNAKEVLRWAYDETLVGLD
jgi:hypothetical protein